MQRVTITLDDELIVELDRMIVARGYQNRSEAIRDLARAGIRQEAATLDEKGDCVAAWSMSTTTMRGSSPDVSPIPFMTITKCRWPRWIRISTTTAAWK